MDKTAIKERRSKAEAEFNELENQKQQIEARQSELRGQWQLLGEQLTELDKSTVSPAADVVDVEAAVKAKK
jgi:predicted  nucleic acid-binding Zn-ribbon protein